MTERPPILCCCGWSGDLATYAPCPECRRPYNDRVTPRRVQALRVIDADPLAQIEPAMRIRLREIGLIVSTGPAPAGRDTPAFRGRVGRPWRLTESGQRVLSIIDAKGVDRG